MYQRLVRDEKLTDKKDDPILNMTPKQVTHVRICQILLLIVQQTQDQHNPLKLEKLYYKSCLVFLIFYAEMRSQTS